MVEYWEPIDQIICAFWIIVLLFLLLSCTKINQEIEPMKFESKFGLGEICTYHDDSGAVTTRRLRDLLVKIVSIAFGDDGSTCIQVEHVTSTAGMQRFFTTETNLGGDPEYDQEAGCYPDTTGGTNA